MKTRIGIILGGLILLSILGLGNTAPARAAPPAQEPPNYTIGVSVSAHPKDPEYVASFSPEVPALYAWIQITTDEPQEEIPVDLEFIAPDGTTVASTWYDGDDGKVLTLAKGARGGPPHVARRELRVAGTRNAQLTGAWTVNAYVFGDFAFAQSFTLESAAEIAQGQTQSDAKQALLDKGYDVLTWTEDIGANEVHYALVRMRMADKNMYSAAISQQLVDGMGALRTAFPQATELQVWLNYDQRYDIVFYIQADGWDGYLASQDFEQFLEAADWILYDIAASSFVEITKDFIDKNFGAGWFQPPQNPPGARRTQYGSLQVTVSPQTLPADGASQAQITMVLYDKQNRPAPNVEIELSGAGSGSGKLRPGRTATDAQGQARAVFIAGDQSGCVTITAEAGDTLGTAVIIIGAGSGCTATDNVVAYLGQKGYKVPKAGYYTDSTDTAMVQIDLKDGFTIGQMEQAIFDGLTALRKFFPEAVRLDVWIPLRDNYLVFIADAARYDQLIQDFKAANSDQARRNLVDAFMDAVYARSVVLDRNGQRVSAFKDFINKNFGG